jgi:hypothetical protein
LTGGDSVGEGGGATTGGFGSGLLHADKLRIATIEMSGA